MFKKVVHCLTVTVPFDLHLEEFGFKGCYGEVEEVEEERLLEEVTELRKFRGVLKRVAHCLVATVPRYLGTFDLQQ